MLIVDASVAIKWLVVEDRMAEAKALLATEDKLTAPRFILLEVAHVLWKLNRKREISDDKRMRALGMMRDVFSDGADTDSLAARAIAMANTFALPVYDCLYIALAEREAVLLVTADERQFIAARTAKIEARLL